MGGPVEGWRGVQGMGVGVNGGREYWVGCGDVADGILKGWHGDEAGSKSGEDRCGWMGRGYTTEMDQGVCLWMSWVPDLDRKPDLERSE